MGNDKENSRYGEATCETARGFGRQEKIEEDIYSLTFSVNKSIRYHSKRRQFFDYWHSCCDALTAISGSSAFVALLSEKPSVHIALWLSAIVAISTSCDLVIGLSKKGQQYDDLKKRFSRLLNEIIIGDHTMENLVKWKSERISIEKDEPTFLTLLNTICHNEECIALGDKDSIVPNMGWRFALRDWFSFDGFHQKITSQTASDLSQSQK